MKAKIILLTLAVSMLLHTFVFAEGEFDSMQGMLGNNDANYTKPPTIFCHTAGDSFAVIKDDNSLYGWGNNSKGGIGNGQGFEDYYDFNKSVWIRPFVDEPYKILDNVKYYGGQTWAIKNDNSLWVWGPTAVAVGLADKAQTAIPQKYMDDVISFSVGESENGDKYFYVVKTDGTLLGWGKNSFGELGDGTTDERVEPTYIMSDVVSVQCFKGSNGVSPYARPGCSFAIKSDGSLWWWGASTTKMCFAHWTSVDAYYQPVPTKILDNVNSVSASRLGCAFTAITNNGDLYVWGLIPNYVEGAQRYNQSFSSNLGSGSSTRYYITKPYLLQKNVIEAHTIALAGYNYVYLTANGDVFYWGSFGEDNFDTPEIIISDVATMSSDESALYACKMNNELWCIESSYYDADRNYIPVSSKKMCDDVLDVKGIDPTFIIKTDGSLWGIGNDDRHSLMGKGNHDTFVKLMDGIKISQETERSINTTNDSILTDENNIKIEINGNQISFDQPPIIEDGRTLVPFRAIFEALGATVHYWEGKNSVEAEKGNMYIKLTIGENRLFTNNSLIILDVPAKIVNNRTLVPVRAVSEAFGCNVDWDGDTQTVYINSK